MALTFQKRVNPHGRSLRQSSKYYKPPLNTCLFNSASGGNCVWYAYGRFLEVWSEAPKAQREKHPWPGAFQGNGCQMVRAAKSRGFKTGLTPKPGAIICWGYYGTPNGSPGHVAFVEDVKTDSHGTPISIEVSQSGWSCGDMKNQILYRGDGQPGTNAWNFGYNRPYFVGFAYNPINFAGSSGYINGDGEDAGGSFIDFQKRASKLSSSDNYKFIEQEKPPEETYTGKYGKSLLAQLQLGLTDYFSYKDKPDNYKKSDNTLAESILKTLDKAVKVLIESIPKTKSNLLLADSVVEAPFIEIEIGGNKIGSYGGNLDTYPNYVSQLNVNKKNGVINLYTIQLTHQVRAGDDSNLLDKVFSQNNYDKIKIKYGDCNSGQYFLDSNVIITNVSMSRDYSSMNISYTVEATSEGSLLKTINMGFPAITDKPSNVLRNLLYNNAKTSPLLLDAFQGMRDVNKASNYIPTNDSVVNLDSFANTNVLDYMNYLVANMSNSSNSGNTIRNSTYYISYVDDTSNGNYFKINEITAGINPFGSTNRIYDLTIGYNDDMIFDFNVESTKNWELLYETATKTNEYYYTITDNGDINKYYSPSVTQSTSILSEVNKNWWTDMIKFPITATLTIKGLLSPTMLMDYININVLFYGVKHITSGVYAITGQTDTLSASGYRTVLNLVRVSDNA